MCAALRRRRSRECVGAEAAGAGHGGGAARWVRGGRAATAGGPVSAAGAALPAAGRVAGACQGATQVSGARGRPGAAAGAGAHPVCARSACQQRLSYTTLSELALALLDGTVFEIVQGLLEIQHLTEKNLYSQRRQLHSEHRGTGATVGGVTGRWGDCRGERWGEGQKDGRPGALEGTAGVDGSGEMGVALQGSDGDPAGGDGPGASLGWGGGSEGTGGWSGGGTRRRQVGEAVGTWGWHWRGEGG